MRRSPANVSETLARHRGRRGVGRELDAVERRPLRTRLGERGRAHHDGAAAGGHGVHAGLIGERLQRAVGRPPPHVDRRRVVDVVGGEHDARPVDRRHRADLQVGRRDRLAIDQQALGAVAVDARDERPVGGDGWHAGDEVHPRVVAVVGEVFGRPRRRIDPAELEPPLVAALHRHQQPGVAPVDVGEVREGVAIPLHVDHRTVEAEDVQRHVGVGGAGGRVRQLPRCSRGIGGIGEVPALHRRRVDAGDGEGGAVGAPPVAAVAVHLLGGDEVRRTPRHRLRLVRLAAGQQAPATVELADAQQAPVDVRHPVRQRVRPRIEHRAGDGELACRAADQAADEQPPTDGKRCDGDGGIGGEGRDPAGRLADPLAACPFLGRQRLVVAPEDLGVGDEAFLTRRGVDDPEAVDRVGAAAAA